MLRFRQTKTQQKFASVHASIHDHFSQERHLVDRQTYKLRRSAALSESQGLANWWAAPPAIAASIGDVFASD